MCDDETKKYALMGMAAMLPGMELAVEVLQRQIAEMRAALNGLQEAEALPTAKRKVNDNRGGWPADPQARKEEMARRLAARKANSKGHKLSEAAKERWAAMSTRQRKARLAAMEAGKQKKLKEAA